VEPIRESGDPPVERRGPVEWTAESIANAVLAGCGPSFVSSALAAGVSSSTIVEGITQAACHVFSALPELRQLHGVTVSRAVGEGVLFHRASPRVALVELARFVGLGWSSAQRSGRILPGREVSHLIEPGLDFDPEISLLLCQREATPNFGHLIKLVDAASALPALMSPGLGERWAGEVLRAASRKATPYRRVWATVQRHLLASI